MALLALNHIGTNPSRKNPTERVRYNTTLFQGITIPASLSLKTLLFLGASLVLATGGAAAFMTYSSYRIRPGNILMVI
jgi:hypothetical protein